MKTIIIVWSLVLAAVPALAQQTANSVRRTLPIEASHVSLPSKPVAPAKTEKPPDAGTAAKPEGATAATEKPTAAKPATAAPAAEKPAVSKAADSAESAAERIMRRLDEAFPKKAPGDKAAATKAPSVKTQPARYTTGTPVPPRASKRVTLSWRIALQWPDEIAPAHQVK
jgi:hypothetical protein